MQKPECLQSLQIRIFAGITRELIWPKILKISVKSEVTWVGEFPWYYHMDY